MRGCPSSFCFPQRKGGLPSLSPADSAGAVSGGGGQGGRSPAAPAIPAPAGGACLSPRLPTLPLALFLPPSPRPLPGGKGETKVIFMQGASPLASPRLNPRGTSYPRRLRPRRGGVPPWGTCTAGTVSAANGLMQGCRGRSPRRNKLIVSPFPTGEGGWGIGGRKVNQRRGRKSECHKILSPAGASDARQAQPGEQATQATQAEHCRQAPSGTRHRTP